MLALLLVASVVTVEGSYVVRADEGARTLAVEARWSSLPGEVLTIEARTGAFVSDVMVQTSGGWVPADHRRDQVFVDCLTGCSIRYRFALAEAARQLANRNVAFEHHGALLAPPSTFLFRPARQVTGRFRLDVETRAGTSFVTGLAASGSGWEATWSDLPQAPWSGFGPFQRDAVEVPGGVLDLAVAPGAETPAPALLRRWASRAGEAVAATYGGLPVPRVLVLALPGTTRRGVGFGTTLGNGGASVMVWMGRGTTGAQLDADWVLTHELMHTGMPNLARPHRWLEEGLATYLEEIGRARAGLVSEEEAWTSFVRGMPKGQPVAGDRGLDHTPTWGRTYWGGALFALVADVEIRERTGGRRGLDDALRAIVGRGGTIATRWPMARVLATGDEATGTSVLQEMYARWSRQPVAVDLPALFRRLGVRTGDGGIRLEDTSPAAAVRRALTGRTERAVPRGDTARGAGAID